eukprot:Sspe_Gene.60983::Locus_33718_Transcript_1_2_Confidence_0.750_Length_1912::g.60983::m.60983
MLPDTQVTTRVIAPGGRTLRQHFLDMPTRNVIEAGEYDVIVLQEQSQLGGMPSRMCMKHGDPDDHDTKWLREAFAWSEQLGEVVNKHNATVVLFQTWGRRTGDPQYPDYLGTFKSMQRLLSENYATLHDSYRRQGLIPDEKCRIAPVGEVFEAVYDSANPGEVATSLFHRLYSSDSSHPSVMGTFVAAHTLFATINIERTGEWRAPSSSYRPSGVGEAEAGKLIEYSWSAAAPVSPQLQRIQGLYMRPPKWETYILRGRKLLMADALPGETPPVTEIDDTGPTLAPRSLVEIQEDGGRGRLIIGDDYYIAYYETDRVRSSTVCDGLCSLHVSKETCAANKCCEWYKGRCSKPCSRYEGWYNCHCMNEGCMEVENQSGLTCTEAPWNNSCDVRRLCMVNKMCTENPGRPIYTCSPRCNGHQNQSVCTADTICKWGTGVCTTVRTA